MRHSIRFVVLIVLGLFAHPVLAQSTLTADSAAGAKDAIKAIWEAANIYYQDKGEWPEDLKALTDSGHYQGHTFPPYLTILKETRNEWKFSLEYGGPPNMIRAKSKTRTFKFEGDTYMPLQIDYETARGRWQGYGIPHYDKDTLTAAQKAELATEAKNALHAIYEGAKVYYNDKGIWPEIVEQLDRQSYIGVYHNESGKPPEPPIGLVYPSVFTQWDFALIGTPPEMVVAISRDGMPGGAGKGIQYDCQAKTFRGYGIENGK